MADEVDVDEELDPAFIVDAHEIDMRRQVFDHIALDAPADDVNVGLAFDLEVEERLQEPALPQLGRSSASMPGSAITSPPASRCW